MNELLYQTDPPLKTPSMWKNKGWTDSIEGYMREADQLARCLMRNQRYMPNSYKWAVCIYIHVEMSPSEVKSLWTKAARRLKDEGVVALWVREPTKNNRIHYHLIVNDNIGKKQLADAIERAMPNRADISWHKQIKPIKSDYNYTRYLGKAKTAERKGGKVTKRDKWKAKRLLFQKNLGLKKVGCINKSFWIKPKKVLWKEISDIEKRIGDGLEQFGVEELAECVADMIGEPLKDVRRRLAFHSNDTTIQDWIETVVTTSSKTS